MLSYYAFLVRAHSKPHSFHSVVQKYEEYKKPQWVFLLLLLFDCGDDQSLCYPETFVRMKYCLVAAVMKSMHRGARCMEARTTAIRQWISMWVGHCVICQVRSELLCALMMSVWLCVLSVRACYNVEVNLRPPFELDKSSGHIIKKFY